MPSIHSSLPQFVVFSSETVITFNLSFSFIGGLSLTNHLPFPPDLKNHILSPPQKNHPFLPIHFAKIKAFSYHNVQTIFNYKSKSNFFMIKHIFKGPNFLNHSFSCTQTHNEFKIRYLRDNYISIMLSSFYNL